MYSNNSNINQPRKRRILRELYYAAKVIDENSREYDPNIAIFPFASCLDIWQVFLKGEDNSPYEGKWFFLLVTFPELYPYEAPVFRFISIPYHLNISSEGRICLNILEKDYIPSMHVIDIIQQFKEFFIYQSIESPVQIEILETFMQNKDEYYQKAKESAQRVDKDDFKEFWPSRVSIQDRIEKGFQLSFEINRARPIWIVVLIKLVTILSCNE